MLNAGKVEGKYWIKQRPAAYFRTIFPRFWSEMSINPEASGVLNLLAQHKDFK